MEEPTTEGTQQPTIEAYIISYCSSRFTLGGWGGDRETRFPSRAIMIPSERLLLDRNSSSDVMIDPSYLIYKTYSGGQC